jgi:hypothetical protein
MTMTQKIKFYYKSGIIKIEEVKGYTFEEIISLQRQLNESVHFDFNDQCTQIDLFESQLLYVGCSCMTYFFSDYDKTGILS